MLKIDVDALVAIDIHTHAEMSTRLLPDQAGAEAGLPAQFHSGQTGIGAGMAGGGGLRLKYGNPCTSTMSRPISPICRSSPPIPACRGRTSS